MSNDKVTHVRAKADEVTDIMRDNIDKALERGERLDDISDKADRLEDRASQFKKKSTDLKWQLKCRNIKLALLIFVILAAILCIILWAAGAFDSDDSKSKQLAAGQQLVHASGAWLGDAVQRTSRWVSSAWAN